MMRARGGPGELRASTHQYHPRVLLYATESDWHMGDMTSVANRIRSLLPADLHAGFCSI